MPNSIFVTKSTLTDRYQTQTDRDEADPDLQSFLYFLAKNIQENPERLVAVTPDLISRLTKLVGTINVDLDSLLDDQGR